MNLIGIDIGGTQIKGVITNLEGEILNERTEPTNDIDGIDNSKVWKASIKSIIQDFHSQLGQNVPVGLASSGLAKSDNSAILSNGTKMIGIDNFDWTDYIGERVFVLNDAHAAMYAESRLGAGIGYQNLLMMTLGTGVGGAIMLDGKLVQSTLGRAGHIGHLSVNRDHELSIVGSPGSLEVAIGEGTIEKRTYGLYKSTKDLVDAHIAGETFANYIWLSTVQTLARGIVSLVNVISPELIILGGGISKAGDHLLKPLKDFLNVYEWRPGGYATPIRFTQLGSHAGAIGAALFAHDNSELK